MIFSDVYRKKEAKFIYKENKTKITVDLHRRHIEVETDLQPCDLLARLFDKFTQMLSNHFTSLATVNIGAKWLVPILKYGCRIKFTGEVDIPNFYPTDIHEDILKSIYKKQYRQVLSRLLFSDEFNPLINFSNYSQIYDYIDLLSCYGTGNVLDELIDESTKYAYKNRKILIANRRIKVFPFVSNLDLLNYAFTSSEYDIRDTSDIDEGNILRCKTNMQAQESAMSLINTFFECLPNSDSMPYKLLAIVYCHSKIKLRVLYKGSDEIIDLLNKNISLMSAFKVAECYVSSSSSSSMALMRISGDHSIYKAIPPIVPFQFDRKDWNILPIAAPLGPSSLTAFYFFVRSGLSMSKRSEYLKELITQYYRDEIPPFNLNKKDFRKWCKM